VTQSRTYGRRDFLRIIAAGSVAGLTALKLGWDRTPQPEVVTETRLLMGTIINLTVVTTDADAGRQAIAACLGQMANLEAVLSRHQPESQLSRLNREGQLQDASPILTHVLGEAAQFSAMTGGAFDVSVKPLVDLYQEVNGLPTKDAIQNVLPRVGYQQIVVDENNVSFSQPNMAITLDGIAKGYIVDQGLAVLQNHGFGDILVEAGGDLSTSGAKSARPWQIGIQSPRENGTRYMHTFSVANQAVATSGDYMQPYTDDLTAHHIIDPRTGYSVPELASATVVAASGIQADALATALMVMGAEQGRALVETTPDCEAYLVAKDLSIWHSSGFAV
jgi:FAD:protein FMN transferase